jgi:cell division transport system permease protein
MTNLPPQELSTMRPGQIIPSQAAPLKSLVVTMTIMCYLACLAIGALMVINRAASAWTAGLSQEITVQIRLINGVDIDQELAAAAEILQATPGVVSVEILDRKVGAELLEPWLGTSNLDELPIPRLIRVTIDDQNPPDFMKLETSLKERVKGASLDTHRRWQGELTRMARNLSLLSIAILTLIIISAVAMVIFATRTVLDANRKVVDVLHLVGARDDYIARQIDRRFLRAGWVSGVIGVGGGLLTFLILGYALGTADDGLAAAGRSLLFAPQSGNWTSYLAFVSVPIAATIIAVMTSRLTLMRMLRDVI